MVIDFHTHIFPDAIAPKALARLVDNLHTYAHLYGETVPHTDATLNGLHASGQAHGIDCQVVMPIATSSKPSSTLNDFAAQVDRTPGFRSFGSIHPANPEWPAELERIAALGLKGIKLHPEYQQFFVDDPAAIQVVKAASAYGLWVLFHAGADVGLPPPFHCTPDRVIRLRQAVPEARIILAHMGGYLLWEEVLRALPEMDALLDTSFCLPNHPERWDLFASLIRENGTDRILFGTDSPWEDQGIALQRTTDFFARYAFTPDEQAAILSQNARRILGIETPTAV